MLKTPVSQGKKYEKMLEDQKVLSSGAPGDSVG